MLRRIASSRYASADATATISATDSERSSCRMSYARPSTSSVAQRVVQDADGEHGFRHLLERLPHLRPQHVHDRVVLPANLRAHGVRLDVDRIVGLETPDHVLDRRKELLRERIQADVHGYSHVR